MVPFRFPVAATFIALVVVLFAGCSSTTDSRSEKRVHYSVRFPDLVQHEAQITATFTGIPAGQTLELRMARTSPGRYSLHEFAKNVYDVHVSGASGNSIIADRPNPHQWDVSGHEGTVMVTYTLYGDHADGTYNGFDRTFAHMNMPASFMWARGFGDAPITVRFTRPDSSWDIATQLFPTDDADVFTAPDLDYFMDSPTRIAPLEWYSMSWGEGDSGVEVRLALQHEGSREQGAAFADNLWKIVRAQYDVYGAPPEYDGGVYTFLTVYLPHVFGDGMEHRNSTIVTGNAPLNDEGTANLSTMSHEFFHQWNVERVRPQTLEPFDFEGANISDVLWLAEGFTSYYTPLTMRRAGVISVDEYISGLAPTISTVLRAPGRSHRSLAEMSQWATFSDRGVFGDRVNVANTFISYYTWGSALGLALDLELRTQYGTDLDAYMRAMWDAYGQTEIPYRLAEARAVLGSLTGDTGFARSFFDSFVSGRDVPDFESLLLRAGILLRRSQAGKAFFGGTVQTGEGGLRIVTAPLEGSPAFEAGLDEGDLMTMLNGHSLSSLSAFESLLGAASPGDVWSIGFTSRGQTVETSVTLGEDAALETVRMEETGMVLSEEAESIRNNWLRGSGAFSRPE